jgi:hypothetical protein
MDYMSFWCIFMYFSCSTSTIDLNSRFSDARRGIVFGSEATAPPDVKSLATEKKRDSDGLARLK